MIVLAGRRSVPRPWQVWLATRGRIHVDIGEDRRRVTAAVGPGDASAGRAVRDPVPRVVQRQRLEADRDLPGDRRGRDRGGGAGADGDRPDRAHDPAHAHLDAGGRAGRPVQQAVDHRRHQGLRAGPHAAGRGGADRPGPTAGRWRCGPRAAGRAGRAVRAGQVRDHPRAGAAPAALGRQRRAGDGLEPGDPGGMVGGAGILQSGAAPPCAALAGRPRSWPGSRPAACWRR